MHREILGDLVKSTGYENSIPHCRTESVVKVSYECKWITNSISVFIMISEKWVGIMLWKFEGTSSVLVKVKSLLDVSEQ